MSDINQVWGLYQAQHVVNGELVLSDRPGLGFQFDEAELAKYAL